MSVSGRETCAAGGSRPAAAPVRPDPPGQALPGQAPPGPALARPGQHGARPAARRGHRVAWLAGCAAACVLLFGCYLRISQTAAVNSDGAANALQAWDMLHGNVLLHGWWLSDVSFYTTELPEYMLVELARGLSPGVVHVAAAVTYTLGVLLAALLAMGRAGGRTGLTRALLAAGIMLAPQLGGGVSTLLLSPDHVGTSVALLAVWLIIDRCPAAWYPPVLAGLLLAWVQVADSLALLAGAVPLAGVCAVRAGARFARRPAARPEPAGSAAAPARWYEPALALAALASVPVAALAARLIRADGGYDLWPVDTRLAPARTLPAHLALAGQSVLQLFGSYFPGLRPGAQLVFAVAHLAGLALAAAGLAVALRRFFRADSLLPAVLAAAVVVNLAAFVASRSAMNLWSSREIAAVLPFGAVLGGRLMAGPLLRAAGRLRPGRAGADRPAAAGGPAAPGRRAGRAGQVGWAALLAAGTACAGCYVAALGYSVTRPPVPAETADLAAWLAARHLRGGLGGYWQAVAATLASSGRILVSAMSVWHGHLVPARLWETRTSWYDPARQRADFVVTVSGPPSEADAAVMARAARRDFGRPARVYRFGRYAVLVWHRNLLAALPRPGAPAR